MIIQKFLPLFKHVLAVLLFFSAFGTGYFNSAQAADPKDYWFYIINDRDDQLKDLLRRGMDPNQKNPNQQTPLTMAARENSGACPACSKLLDEPKLRFSRVPGLSIERLLQGGALAPARNGSLGVVGVLG
jgi:ankyrin repeat protein